MRYFGKIVYTIDKNHPESLRGDTRWMWNTPISYADVYTFNDEIYKNTSESDIILYIKRDLKLVAGGGYNSDHIHNVMFDIYRMD